MLSETPPTPRRRPLVGLPLAWAAFILVSTLTPAADMPLTPRWELLSFDTAAHAGVFGVLTVLAIFSARRQRRLGWLRTHAFRVALALAVVLGALVEVLQHLLAMGRHGEWSDLFSDALGAAAGTAFMWFTRRFWQ
ncbi:VanZ family protein [Hymenobacter terrestris]|uniref:VanZ family protein n=1 Tax=Hymenobacter terrestris TaxID=2748310 RepID=A0ABX2PXR8_9BACT|nr:VanZ family protein [Hymenobacter terrestris]NVO83451.1 VanZ family protein [Hymenobacter terrestris]